MMRLEKCLSDAETAGYVVKVTYRSATWTVELRHPSSKAAIQLNATSLVDLNTRLRDALREETARLPT